MQLDSVLCETQRPKRCLHSRSLAPGIAPLIVVAIRSSHRNSPYGPVSCRPFRSPSRRRRNTWPSAVDTEISGLDVVDGSVRSYVRSMADEPGRGLSGGGDDDSVLVAVFGWHRDGGGRAVLAGQVVTFDMSGSGAVNRYGAEPRGVH